ncbi:MAG: hypothetical protein C0503_04450 [Gemmatimonas sp.]|nr:hypothetical protein [Gemmatimonas sp.]
MYEAAQTQRRLIRDQLNTVEGEREEVAQQLRQPGVEGVDKQGLEQHLRTLDIRILDLRQQLADAQLRESQAAALPGSTQESPQQRQEDQLEMFLVAGTIVTLVLGFPLVVGYARRMWKKAAVTLSMTPELDRRLDAIDRSLEATALEVERIGEGQRFVTQLLAKRAMQDAAQALPSAEEPRQP